MSKPTFLFYNLGGDFLGIQMRIQSEGFPCVAYYHPDSEKRKNKTGCGLIEIVDDEWEILNRFKDNPDDLIILIDDSSKGNFGDFLRSKGFPVIGTSHYADEIELNRGMGSKLAEEIGMKVPLSHSFTDIATAQKFLEGKEGNYFFKGDGADLAGGSKTFGGTVLALQKYLEWLKGDQSVHNYTIEKFILQESIEGIEVDMACWYDGEKYADIQAVCFEQKKVNGLGAAQGCTGQVITFIPPTEPYTAYFDRLKQKLTGTGPNEWGINAIIKDGEPFFLEWTPRFGWDATFGELALLQDAGIPVSQFYMRLAYKQSLPTSWFPIGRYSASVRLFSESHGTPHKDVCGKPLWIDPSVEKNIWYYAVKQQEDSLVITDSCFGVATACGDTPEEAVASVYRIIDPKNNLIMTPDLFYSKTIGENVPEALRELKKYGMVDEY